MRRPWELGRMERRGCPRVYVPVSLPDTSSASFAVLELVGFSSSPDSSHASVAPFLQPLHSLQALNSPSCPLITCLDSPNSATNEHNDLPLSPPSASIKIPQFPMAACATPTPLAGPPLTPSSVKKMVAVDGRVQVVQTDIKENVVHTTSLNFKDVVQKLTGASPNDQGIMPVTLPNRPVVTPIGGRASPNKVLDALSVKLDVSKGLKKSPSKLHERRKSLNNLERLCTDKHLALSESSLPSPSPSPSLVSPLASYFELLCNAFTRKGSQISHCFDTSSPRHSFFHSGSLNVPTIESSTTTNVVENVATVASRGGVQALTNIQQCASLLETLHGPSLLSLFPESPLCSPRNFSSPLP